MQLKKIPSQRRVVLSFEAQISKLEKELNFLKKRPFIELG